MLRRVDLRQLLAARRDGRSLFPVIIVGLGIWIGFPTVAAFQDMQSLVSGSEGSNARWNSFVETAVAGSTHAAEMPFVDTGLTTGSISGSGMTAPGIGAVALRGKGVSRRRDAGRGPHRARRQEGPRRQGDAGDAAKSLQCRLGVQAHLDAASTRRSTRSSRWRSPSPRSKARKSRSPRRSTFARSPRPIRCCRRSSPPSSTPTIPTCWRRPMRRPSPTMPRPRPSRRCSRTIPPIAAASFRR